MNYELGGKRIVVTGATGFLGRHLLPVLRARYACASIAGLSRCDYDLEDPTQVRLMFEERRPQVLVHLAAYAGGIGANREFPADFYHRNTLLTALVFHEAATHGVERLLYTIGGCSYPASAHSPICEDQMWDGFPQPESAPYATAKKMGLVASDAYRRQYELQSVVIVPGNMYGEYDNFHRRDSHVIPAIIRRYYEAAQSGQDRVVMWGSGAPVRDFVYAGDVAAAIPRFLENFDETGPVNVSSGTGISICQLAQCIARAVGFQGTIDWDVTKPDGQMVKVFDISKLRSLGMCCSTPLEEGIRRTAAWLSANYPGRTDGIRL